MDETTMRKTIEIDDDVLAVATALADSENRPVGAVISDLARKALQPKGKPYGKGDFPVLPVRKGAKPVTLDIVNALRDEGI